MKIAGDREVLGRAKGFYKEGYLNTMKDFSWLSSPQHKDTEDQERLLHVVLTSLCTPHRQWPSSNLFCPLSILSAPDQVTRYRRMNDLKTLICYAVNYWGHHASTCSPHTPQLLKLLTQSDWISMVVH